MMPESTEKRAAALRVARALVRHDDKAVRVEGRLGNLVELPPDLIKLLRHAAKAMARGEEVELVATGQLISTQRAAELLEVSRQTVVRLVESGKLPCVRVGTHRRIHIEHVLDLARGRALQVNKTNSL